MVCQSTMTALSREAALLVNRAVTALLRVWHFLSKAVTALMREIPFLVCCTLQFLQLVTVHVSPDPLGFGPQCTLQHNSC